MSINLQFVIVRTVQLEEKTAKNVELQIVLNEEPNEAETTC